MGWQDDPVVEEPKASRPSWMSDPEVSEPNRVSASSAQASSPSEDAQPPSYGEVLKNVPGRFAANFMNTPHAVTGLILKGISKIPGAENIPELQELKERFSQNRFMDMAEQAGLVDPEVAKNMTGPQRIVDSAIQAAAGALTGPQSGILNAARTVGAKEATKVATRAAGVGTTAGAAGQTAKETSGPYLGETGSTLLAIASGAVAPRVISGPANRQSTFVGTPTKKDLLKEARQEGLVVDPASVRTSRPTEMLESVAGKAAVSQQSSINNQPVINDLAMRSIGLPKGTEVSQANLDAVRNVANTPFRALSAISPQAKQTLEDLQQVRFEATDHWKYYNKTGNPEAGKAARALDRQSAQLENHLDSLAIQAGRADLVPQMKASRKLIARTYDIERAMIEGPGEISAPALAAMKKNGRPLGGELDLIARFQQAFPRSSRVASTVPPPSVSGTDATASMAMAMGGAGVMGPAGAAMGALPLLRQPARKLVLSKMIQDHLLKEAPTTPAGRTAIRSATTANTLFQNNQNR